MREGIPNLGYEDWERGRGERERVRVREVADWH